MNNPPSLTKARRFCTVGREESNVVAPVLLVAIGLITYLPQIGEVGFYLDDWRNLSDIAIYGRLVHTTGRPVNILIWDLGGWLWQLDRQAYLLAALTFHCAAAILLWYVLRKILSEQECTISLMIAALYLVYPSFYSRVWVTMWPSGLLVALVLIGTAGYLAYLKSGALRSLVLALVLWALTLGWYELQLVLIASLPILAIRQLHGASWQRRIGIVAPTILAVIFGVLWLLTTGGGKAYGTTPVNWSEFLLSFPARIWMGWRTVLIYAWTEPLRTLLPSATSDLGILLAIAAGICLTIMLYGLLFLILRWRMPQWMAGDGEHAESMGAWFGRWGSQLALAAGLVIAGMLPVLLVGTPWISTLESRLTMFSAIGGATFVILALYGSARIILRRQRYAILLTCAGTIVLLGVAIPSQWAARSGMVAAWQNQQCLWRAMFTLAPSFTDGSWVHITGVPASVGLWEMPPFQGLDSEVGSAVRLLYNNPTLNGDFARVGEHDRVVEEAPQYLLEGLKPRGSQQIVPWDQVVVFRYNGDIGLERIDALLVGPPDQGEWIQPGVARIKPQSAISPYRSLLNTLHLCP